MSRQEDVEGQFLADFFGADGRAPHSERARQHWRAVFVEPPDLDSLAEDFTPIPSRQTIVLVDGHPRSGKTWATLGAALKTIQSHGLAPEEWWTSGVDSLKVIRGRRTTLSEAIRNIYDALDSIPARERLRFVLIDDLLGTSGLRDLGPIEERDEVRRFFIWDGDNPLLQRLPTGCTIVVTARSLFFAVLDALLDVDSRRPTERGSQGRTTSIAVYNHRQGIFRLPDGRVIGSLGIDPDTLRKIQTRNLNTPFFADIDDPDYVIAGAPMLGFDNAEVTDDQRIIAAQALFGDDIESLVEQIEKARALQAPSGSESAGLARLEQTYLLSIAPGLLFLDASAYEALGIDETAAESLYLLDRDAPTARLPNEFYKIALDRHLEKELGFAVNVFVSVMRRVVQPGRRIGESRGVGLGLRGFIEWARHPGNDSRLEELWQVDSFVKLYEEYQGSGGDCRSFLLEFERSGAEVFRKSPPRGEINAGLAAAVSWAVLRLFPDDPSVQEAGHAWMKRILDEQIGAAGAVEAGSGSAGGSDLLDTHAAFYSVILQWALKGTLRESFRRTVEALAAANSPGSRLAEVRQTILEDELCWALLEKQYAVRRLTAVMRLMSVFRQPIAEVGSPAETSRDERYATVNRFFTLAWHNEWMEQFHQGASRAERRFDGAEEDLLSAADSLALAQDARRWAEGVRPALLRVLSEQPELIDDNLRYHWSLFVTQRATWMRDWCFQKDPNRFERLVGGSQIALGSRFPDDNEWLAEIVGVLLECREICPDRLRTLLLLVGTRRNRFRPGWVRSMLDRVDQLSFGGELRPLDRVVLRSTFELWRQGFLGLSASSRIHESDDGLAFCRWCADRLGRTAGEELEEVWREYHRELQSVSYPLDLLPREHRGWEDALNDLREAVGSETPPRSASLLSAAEARR